MLSDQAALYRVFEASHLGKEEKEEERQLVYKLIS
jgi:hypothetical protein